MDLAAGLPVAMGSFGGRTQPMRSSSAGPISGCNKRRSIVKFQQTRPTLASPLPYVKQAEIGAYAVIAEADEPSIVLRYNWEIFSRCVASAPLSKSRLLDHLVLFTDSISRHAGQWNLRSVSGGGKLRQWRDGGRGAVTLDQPPSAEMGREELRGGSP